MKFEGLIAGRFLQRDKNSFSRPLVNIATYTIALGVVVMIMAVCILRGFQGQITDKVVGFGSHITIRSYGWVNDYDEIPVRIDDGSLAAVSALPAVSRVQPYAYKGGMLKTDEQIQGVIYKGLGVGYDSSFFAKHLVKGRLFSTTDSACSEVVVSQRMANLLSLDTGMKARCYFWVGNNYRARVFRIVGLYNTDLSEFDEHYIIGPLRQVQRLNGWGDSLVAGYEVLLDDFEQLEPTLSAVKGVTPPELSVTSIREEQPSMFAWLDLLNSNIVLILTIMALVCAVSVISALLIMIFEKTSMIGVLKTLGATTASIRRVFLRKALVIVGRGIVVGNVLSLVLCELQMHFHVVRLDSESYSMNFVPVDINMVYFVVISLATLVVCLLAMLLPSTYIAHIDPARSIRVE